MQSSVHLKVFKDRVRNIHKRARGNHKSIPGGDGGVLHGTFFPGIIKCLYTPKGEEGMLTPMLSSVHSKIQSRQWNLTNYSNITCLDHIERTEIFAIFSLGLNFWSLYISPW